MNYPHHTWQNCDVHIILTDGKIVHAKCGDLCVRNNNICMQTRFQMNGTQVERLVSPIMLMATQMMWLNRDIVCDCDHALFSNILGELHVEGHNGSINWITKQTNNIHRIIYNGSPIKEK